MMGALLLGAAQAAAPAPAYPAAEVVSAFIQACADVGDLAKAAGTLTAAGWERYTPAADTPMGRLLAIGRAGVASDPDLVMRDGGTFRRTVAGERLELTLSRVEVAGTWVNGCRVYDFRETRAMPVAVLTARIGRPPESDRTIEGFAKAVWEPGYRDGMLNTELYFVPAGSAASSLIKTDGIAMVAQARGALD